MVGLAVICVIAPILAAVIRSQTIIVFYSIYFLVRAARAGLHGRAHQIARHRRPETNTTAAAAGRLFAIPVQRIESHFLQSGSLFPSEFVTVATTISLESRTTLLV